MHSNRSTLITLLVVLTILLAGCSLTPPPPSISAPAQTDGGAQPPLPTLDPAVGIYKGFFVAASSPGIDSTLYVNVDGSLILQSDYLNGEPPVVEVGQWQRDADTGLRLTLTGQTGRVYATPVVIPVAQTETGLAELTTEGLPRQWIDFAAVAWGEATLPYDQASAQATLENNELENNGLVGIYKALLPAASCCGLDMTLILGMDGTASLQNDYLNGEAPYLETGTWEATEAGALLTLTGPTGGEAYADPAVWNLELVDGRLVKPSRDGSLPIPFHLFSALAHLPQAEGNPETGAGADPLAGTAWQLQQVLMMDDTVLTPGMAATYTLTFLGEGMAAAKIDCNRASGTYTVDGPLLTFGPLATTMMACPDSLVTQRYQQGLTDATSYVLEDGLLHIAFGPDAGILVMEPMAAGE